MPPLDIEELPPGSEELKRIRERMQKAAEKRGTPIRGGGPEAGDEVRVALQKGALGKSYTQNYTDFTLPVERVIHGKKPYMPDRYRLGDGRTYYKEELLNIKDIQIPDKKEKERREPRVQRQAAPVEPKPRRERGRVERDVVEPEQTRGEGGRRYQGREKNVYGRPRYEEAIQALRGKRR
jgi:hypothetical protein